MCMKAKGEDMSAAAPSLEELLSGVSRKTADAPGGGPGRLGPPPEEEENVRHAKRAYKRAWHVVV